MFHDYIKDISSRKEIDINDLVKEGLKKMQLQNSEWEPWLEEMMADNLLGYVRGVNLVLWLIAIVTIYIVGTTFFLRAQRDGIMDSQKRFYQSFGFFFFTMGVTRIFFVASYWIEPYYNLLLVIGYSFAALSLVPLVATIEKYMITQSKHFFTAIGIILTLLSFYFIVFPSQSEISRTIQYVGMPVLGGSFILLYLFVIKNSIGSLRSKAMKTLMGMIIFTLGIILDGEDLLVSGAIPIHLPPIIFTIGIIIIGFSQKMD
jgi:hypothetical protein